VFEWVGWGNVAGAFGLLSALKHFDLEAGEFGELLMKLMSVTIGALSLYLAKKVFTKPQEVKDPQGLAPTRFTFADEVLG
jgi:hypothetical protein